MKTRKTRKPPSPAGETEGLPQGIDWQQVVHRIMQIPNLEAILKKCYQLGIPDPGDLAPLLRAISESEHCQTALRLTLIELTTTLNRFPDGGTDEEKQEAIVRAKSQLATGWVASALAGLTTALMLTGVIRGLPFPEPEPGPSEPIN